MKNVLLFSLFASLLGCGAVQSSSDLSHHKKPSLYKFSADYRPLDGNFQTVIIKQNVSGSYDANFRVVSPGFGAPITDTTTELGSNLECAETKAARTLQVLTCSLDLRPADGELIEVTLTRNESGTYDAMLRKARYATLQGAEVDETTEIALGLQRKR
ncbi:MAG: hypothetical protein H7318_06290 [Oligoflexus sp.]|nr:hypothetical protein [Oligoflexus sp.]